MTVLVRQITVVRLLQDPAYKIPISDATIAVVKVRELLAYRACSFALF
jgi:hypothetical protein